MPVASSPESRGLRATLSAGQQLRLLAWNTLPLLQLAVAALILAGPWLGWPARILVAGGWIFLAPPFAARLLLWRWRAPRGAVPFGGGDFFHWWALINLQGLFNRMPFLEEGLRLVPGLYSAWLRLWGSDIGRSTYWSPGTSVLDRSFLEVGDHVVFGASVKLNPHLLARDRAGEMQLQLAPIRVGSGAIVGGYSVLAPGVEIAPREATAACQVLPPFCRWERGQRVQLESPGAGPLSPLSPSKEAGARA